MNESNQAQIDPEKLCCRIMDVHVALQHAFSEFASGDDDSLECLAQKMHQSLSLMPVFLVGELPPDFAHPAAATQTP